MTMSTAWALTICTALRVRSVLILLEIFLASDRLTTFTFFATIPGVFIKIFFASLSTEDLEEVDRPWDTDDVSTRQI